MYFLSKIFLTKTLRQSHFSKETLRQNHFSMAFYRLCIQRGCYPAKKPYSNYTICWGQKIQLKIYNWWGYIPLVSLLQKWGTNFRPKWTFSICCHLRLESWWVSPDATRCNIIMKHHPILCNFIWTYQSISWEWGRFLLNHWISSCFKKLTIIQDNKLFGIPRRPP